MPLSSPKKHGLVIGGTKGIGRALVRILLAQDHYVSVIGRSVPKNLSNLSTLSFWPVDLLNHKKLSKTLRDIIKRNGKLDNLSFFQRYRGEGESWSGEIETVLTATKYVIDELAGDLKKGSAITLVSSVNAGLISRHLSLGYHVAKSGLSQIARYYAIKLGANGIRVNSVSPGTVLKEESKEFLLKDKKLNDFYKKLSPLKRIGTAEEVAEVIAFLSSPKASLITGQNIIVDGGVSLAWQEALISKPHGK